MKKMKKFYFIVTIIFVITTAFFCIRHSENVILSLNGILIDSNSGETLDEVTIEISGKVLYQFLKPLKFDGIFSIESPIIKSGTNQVCFITFSDSIGFMNYHPEHSAIPSIGFAHIITKDFSEVLIIPYNSDYYIIAPSFNNEQAAVIAEELSSGTIYQDVNWKWRNQK